MKEDGFSLTNYTPEDRKILLKYLDEEVTKFLDPLNSIFMRDSDEKEEPIGHLVLPGFRSFAIKDLEGKPIGNISVSFSTSDRIINVSCWIASNFLGKGYSAKAALAIAKKFY